LIVVTKISVMSCSAVCRC